MQSVQEQAMLFCYAKLRPVLWPLNISVSLKSNEREVMDGIRCECLALEAVPHNVSSSCNRKSARHLLLQLSKLFGNIYKKRASCCCSMEQCQRKRVENTRPERPRSGQRGGCECERCAAEHCPANGPRQSPAQSAPLDVLHAPPASACQPPVQP